MRRIVLALLLAVPLWGLVASQALAGTVWCVVDPILLIDGHLVRIQTFFDASQLRGVSGPVRYTISVPSDVARVQVLKPPRGSIPEEVTVLRSLPRSDGNLLTIQVSVLVQAATTFTTRTVTTGGTENPLTVFGTSNATTTYAFFLER
jgi:hypothetical protein